MIRSKLGGGWEKIAGGRKTMCLKDSLLFCGLEDLFIFIIFLIFYIIVFFRLSLVGNVMTVCSVLSADFVFGRMLT